MKRSRDLGWLIGVGLGILVAIIILIIILFPKETISKELTDNDFKILSASWSTYGTKYDSIQQTYVPDELKLINWTYYCDIKNLDCWGDGKPCKLGNYQLTTQETEDLTCNSWYDGIKEDIGNATGYIFKNGTIIGLGSKVGGLDIRINHDIMICCTSNTKTGEICKSITLPAKC